MLVKTRLAIIVGLVASMIFGVGGSAQAFQPPKPLAFPSSVFDTATKVDGATPNNYFQGDNYKTYVKTIEKNPKAVPAKVPSISKQAEGVGNAGLVMAAFTGSYWLASQATSSIFNVDTTGDIICDMSMVFQISNPCKTALSPVEGFEPNAGIEGGFVPGYIGPLSDTRGNLGFKNLMFTEGSNSAVTVTLTCAKPFELGYTEQLTDSLIITGFAVHSNGTARGAGGTSAYVRATGRLGCDPFSYTYTPSAGRAGEVGSMLGLAFINPAGYTKAGTVYEYSLADIKQKSLGYYALPGTTLRTELELEQGEGANPSRRWVARYECWNPTTGASRQVETTSDPFKETDAMFSPIPPMKCNPGEVLRNYTVDQVTDGDWAPQTVQEYVMPQEQQTAYQAIPEPCLDSSCTLDLVRVIDADTEVSCFSEPALCTNWYTNPQKQTQFKCMYNGAQLILSECAMYRPTFNPAQVQEGEIYGTPKTGATPSTGSTTGEIVGGGTSTPIATEAGSASNASRECFPKGWGVFNPFEWVLKPIKCAFIPTDPTVQFTAVKTALNGVGLAAWQDSLQLPAFSESGCRGIGGTFRYKTVEQELYPFDACSGVMQNVAGFVKPLATAIIAFTGAKACLRALGRGFNWTP